MNMMLHGRLKSLDKAFRVTCSSTVTHGFNGDYPPINKAQQRWESPPDSLLVNRTNYREETPRGRERRTRSMVLVACFVGISFFHRT
ncbi:hypothetical protein F2Q69_00053824 [Brassica cretica]|uniref:Uncharacterized protein n=1 Tax=Brassica cretica TaxID=69181 RepID=A0A8S9N7X6_BRACR|nr:hypothetical protein F2Q69_00053824 [Brassica cretica]